MGLIRGVFSFSFSLVVFFSKEKSLVVFFLSCV